MIKPLKTPKYLLYVIAESICLIFSPVTFCIPSLIIFMPKMKKPSEPAIFNPLIRYSMLKVYM
ncbi:hypothetical protein JBKA6_0061 [Ichthyobacterium seriolicida]|uniref:Uncharacterized protein n=1 Tax=Ichthyobacterium seriolicida TaxID=242600 RepID=A0A1J1DW36_9FLAO|nr:hypothetical protein JBKA6_0061 [Ichthyobacterium seriolicida]